NTFTDLYGNRINCDIGKLISKPSAIKEGSGNSPKPLLMEYASFKYDILNEQESKGKFLVRGVLQRANVKNQNGRVYPKEVLEREASKFYEHFVRNRRALGELDHPESSVVSLSNASHLIVDLRWEDDALMGIIEVLSTPKGEILKSLLR